MKTVYIAHRLFALHDRLLAAHLSHFLQREMQTHDLFLPYCDTDEQTILVEKKGKYLFDCDIERFTTLALLIALLHGPGYDDGVCMEIGYAYGLGIPLLLVTTDFLSYSFRDEQHQFCFADPLFDLLNATVLRLCEPASLSKESSRHRYQAFIQSHEQALAELFQDTLQCIHHLKSQRTPHLEKARAPLKQIYIEVAPSLATSDLTRLRSTIERMGWTCYVASRFRRTITSTEEASLQDLQEAQRSSLLLLDGNGPEVPAGAAFLTGLGLAMQKPTILYYAGAQTTHAPGRETNVRNLMLLYGSTALASTLEQARQLCLAYCQQDAAQRAKAE